MYNVEWRNRIHIADPNIVGDRALMMMKMMYGVFINSQFGHVNKLVGDACSTMSKNLRHILIVNKICDVWIQIFMCNKVIWPVLLISQLPHGSG